MTALEALAELGELAKSAGQAVPSPCISVCRIDDGSGLCLGCFRTLDEIVLWGGLGEHDKRAVWRLVLQRAELNRS